MSKRRGSLNYLLACFLSTAAVALSYWSRTSKLGVFDSAPLIAVVLAALLGGAGPGILATFIGVLSFDYLIFFPQVVLRSPSSYLSISLYFLAAFICGTIVDELRKCYQESELFLLAAEQESAARTKIVGIVAHDLRNPLMNLSMKIHLLRKDASQYAPAGKSLKIFDSMWFSVGRMSRIIDDLLDATRIDKGNFTLQPTACRVDVLLEEILPGLQEIARRTEVKLSSAINPEIREVFCDPFRVGQVLSNLVQNAIKHAPPGGIVHVKVTQSHDGILFAISDNGKGVPADLGERIFDAYTTGSKNGASPGSTGAGLGLFIARAIARCHGGDLHYRNREEGGAEFTFRLPYGPARPRPTQEQVLLQIS